MILNFLWVISRCRIRCGCTNLAGSSQKLMSDWEGPYHIMEKLNNMTYHVCGMRTSKLEVMHVDWLWRYLKLSRYSRTEAEMD